MLDHPLRHILQNLTCYIPGVRALQRARAATGAMNDAAVMTEWTSYIERDVTAAGKAISGSTFLEVGPGHSIGVAVNLIKAGAKRVYALDVEKYADLFALDPKLRERFHYVIVREQADWPIEPQSVDVVYSYFSGEHLRYPERVVKAMQRVLRRDGVCIFAVDLEDHAHRDTNRLQFLYYGPKLWEAMFSQRGAWTNRLLEPNWRDLFQQSFEKVEITPAIKSLPEIFDQNRVTPSFRKYPKDALLFSNIWVVATSPRPVL
jgi:SAM-dependent methyltransferase